MNENQVRQYRHSPQGRLSGLRVLHIGKYFPPYAGGMETYLRDLMEAQASDGLEPAALVHESQLFRVSQVEKYYARGNKVPVTRAGLWARLLYTPISPTFPWHLRRLIRLTRPGILHIHMPNLSAFWVLCFPSARRIPWVIHWHADVVASQHSLGLRIFHSIYRPFERALLRNSRAIIATSPPYLDSSKTLAPFREKCRVVPLGLDPEILNILHDGETESLAPLRILAVGRLTFYKGFQYLIRAVAECEGTEVHLVGAGDSEPRLKALARELDVQDRIIFHGYLPDDQLANQFSRCDCLCLPSIERTEAFGMVLLEAMSHCKATVVSSVEGSGMSWVVEDGITGLHVPPKDVRALASILRGLRDNRDKLQQLGKNGRKKFVRQFHIEKSAAGIYSIYQDLLDNASTGNKLVNHDCSH